jgi:hypothetical protein
MVEVESRQIMEKDAPSFGLLIRSRQRWQFNISLKELLASGFDLKGRTVLETQPIPGLEGVLAPDETLLGEITGIHGDDAEIQTNEGIIRRNLDSLHFQRNQTQISCKRHMLYRSPIWSAWLRGFELLSRLGKTSLSHGSVVISPRFRYGLA